MKKIAKNNGPRPNNYKNVIPFWTKNQYLFYIDTYARTLNIRFEDHYHIPRKRPVTTTVVLVILKKGSYYLGATS